MGFDKKTYKYTVLIRYYFISMIIYYFCIITIIEMLQPLTDYDQYLSLHESSDPVVIYKYNPNQCPLSEKTKPVIEEFLSTHRHIQGYMIDVTTQPELKIQIAEHTNIPHESPQALLFQDGKLIDATSHMHIKRDRLTKSLSL